MPEEWPWPPHIGPDGEILDLSEESKRRGLRMFKVDTGEPIGAETLFHALGIARPQEEPTPSNEELKNPES